MNQLSKLEELQLLPPDQRKTFLSHLDNNTAEDLLFDIKFKGRPKQQYPVGNWDTWMILAGRGFGKTFTGSNTVNNWALNDPGCTIAIVVETAKDITRVLIEGNGGILKQSNPNFTPVFISGVKNYFKYPNGSLALVYNGSEPDQLRGPEHHYAWVDELAKMRYQQEVWDMLLMGMRLGDHPKVLVTTTPKPTILIKSLYKDPDTVVTEGSTYENSSNLPDSYLAQLKKKYDGTRLGQQELYAKILDDNPNALFKSADIELTRITASSRQRKLLIESLDRVVVAVDPAVSANENSDETGIIVAGRKGDNGYIIADGSLKGTPNEWAAAAVHLYKLNTADRIVAEKNQGGLMVESTIRTVDKFLPITLIHASKGKASRAEPIAALYEQHRVHHVGLFVDLEEQMVSFDPSLGNKQKSPDRLDALVYALAELFENDKEEAFIWAM